MNALLEKNGLLEGAKATTGNFSLRSKGLSAQYEKQSLLRGGRGKITVGGTDTALLAAGDGGELCGFRPSWGCGPGPQGSF